MKSQIEEMSAFKSTIRNNPFESLKTLKEKMHDPERPKHEHTPLTKKTIERVVSNTKQDFDETMQMIETSSRCVEANSGR